MEPEQDTDPLRAILEARRAHIEKHAALLSSKDYSDTAKYTRRMCLDFVRTVSAIGFYSTRARSMFDKMLVIRAADDAIQSGLAVLSLINDGMLNPAHRELRYLVERAVKSLYVDQQNPGASLQERIVQLEAVPRSLEVAASIQVSMFDATTAAAFVAELNDVYTNACRYVHPSRSQVEALTASAEAGAPLGFETVEQLRTMNRVAFRAFDLVLVLFFHALGSSMTGDVFIHLLDDAEWSYHKGKYCRLVSKTFDYKAERND